MKNKINYKKEYNFLNGRNYNTHKLKEKDDNTQVNEKNILLKIRRHNF